MPDKKEEKQVRLLELCLKVWWGPGKQGVWIKQINIDNVIYVYAWQIEFSNSNHKNFKKK